LLLLLTDVPPESPHWPVLLEVNGGTLVHAGNVSDAIATVDEWKKQGFRVAGAFDGVRALHGDKSVVLLW